MKCLFVLFVLFAVSQGSSLESTKNMEERFMDLPFGGFLDPITGNLTSRIIGGTAANPGEFPYQISFQFQLQGSRYHFCGGSILSPNKIATAAHCCAYAQTAQTPPTTTLMVVAGAQQMNISEIHQQVKSVIRMEIHPDYNSTSMDKDACKLFLNSPLDFNNHVSQIRLCSSEPIDEICTASGWGTTSPNSTVIPTNLQKVNLAILQRSKCNEDYGFSFTRSMLCAGKVEGESICYGDSGGPLVCRPGGHGERKCLAGATSWGVDPCAQKDYPGVFTNVAYLQKFYRSN